MCFQAAVHEVMKSMNVLTTRVYTHIMKHLENELRIYSRQNFIITILSVAKFISESDIGGHPISHYPGSNVDDQSTLHRGSMNFEILISVILKLCPSQIQRRSERLRQVTKVEVE